LEQLHHETRSPSTGLCFWGGVRHLARGRLINAFGSKGFASIAMEAA